MLLKVKCQFSGSLCKVEIEEIIFRMIPSGSGYFIRLDLLARGLGHVRDSFPGFCDTVGDLRVPGAHNPHRKSVMVEKYARTLCATGHMAPEYSSTC